MPLFLTRKTKLLLTFIILAAFAGLLYQLLREGRIDHNALLMGSFLGFGFGVIELYLLSGLRKFFLDLPLSVAIFVKALIYLLIINFFSGILGLVTGVLDGKQMDEFYESMLGMDQIILNLYTLAIYILLSLYTQINYLLGEGVLLKFLFGKYRKPTSENRIFMFLDLKSSTTIAEKLGHEKYYSFLNDFFHEISEPVRSTNAEIYQYVGDEVVFTWKTDDGLSHSNCIRIFFRIKEKVHDNKEYYQNKYGEIPHFKAGLHFGEVISAQIGDIKRDIVYNGDVLNTSARIQEQCNVYRKELLISDNLLNRLDIKGEYETEMLDQLKLRGKENSVGLISLTQRQNKLGSCYK